MNYGGSLGASAKDYFSDDKTVSQNLFFSFSHNLHRFAMQLSPCHHQPTGPKTKLNYFPSSPLHSIEVKRNVSSKNKTRLVNEWNLFVGYKTLRSKS